MKTIKQEFRDVGSSAYWGGREDWLIVYAIHRDSDCLARSNFECLKAALKELPAVKNWTGEFTPVAIERASHWAVGWIDYLLIDPQCPEAIELAGKLLDKIEDYPVLNEDHYSQLENEEANQVWRDCYRPKDRIVYIREHRRQFEFHDFKDLLGCVRGEYFCGYASELIN